MRLALSIFFFICHDPLKKQQQQKIIIKKQTCGFSTDSAQTFLLQSMIPYDANLLML